MQASSSTWLDNPIIAFVIMLIGGFIFDLYTREERWTQVMNHTVAFSIGSMDLNEKIDFIWEFEAWLFQILFPGFGIYSFIGVYTGLVVRDRDMQRATRAGK